MALKTALISHPVFQQHEMTPGHPESPQRLMLISEHLAKDTVMKNLALYTAPLAMREQILRVHDEAYIDKIEAASPRTGLKTLNADTSMNPFTLEATTRAAGAACMAAKLVYDGEVNHAFCAVRPCGHHATRKRSMGFCIYNGIAVGAAYALNELGLNRVAVLDFDVHHGNGTEDIFHDDPRVLFASSFQHPFYPNTNPESDRPHIIKSPLKGGKDGKAFRGVVEDQWLPKLHDFKPQMIFLSAGFDAHKNDPLAHLRWDEDDYVWFTEQVVTLANTYCPGRVVSYLEGGYHLQALAESVVAHINVLAADS